MANSVSLNSKTISSGSRVAQQGEVSGAARAKMQWNAAIADLSATVSIGAQNDPQALLYKSAITNVNEALEAELGGNVLLNAARQDNSPEATAQRIVSVSTGFLAAFKRQNPEMEDDAALQKFMDTVKGGVRQGFDEARDILKGLQVLDGDVAGNIDKTYGLVMKGLDEFAANVTPPREEAVLGVA